MTALGERTMKKLIILIPLLFLFTACGSLHTYTLDYDERSDDAEDALMDYMEQEMEDMSESQDDYYERIPAEE